MLLAETAPVTTTAQAAVPVAVQADHFIIGDLHKVCLLYTSDAADE